MAIFSVVTIVTVVVVVSFKPFGGRRPFVDFVKILLDVKDICMRVL